MIPVETPEIDIGQLAGSVRGGAAIIDVREPGGYVAGRVPGAVLIPVGQLRLPGGRRDERVGPVRPPRRRRLCPARLRTHPSPS